MQWCGQRKAPRALPPSAQQRKQSRKVIRYSLIHIIFFIYRRYNSLQHSYVLHGLLTMCTAFVFRCSAQPLSHPFQFSFMSLLLLRCVCAPPTPQDPAHHCPWRPHHLMPCPSDQHSVTGKRFAPFPAPPSGSGTPSCLTTPSPTPLSWRSSFRRRARRRSLGRWVRGRGVAGQDAYKVCNAGMGRMHISDPWQADT